jgi:dUTPase
VKEYPCIIMETEKQPERKTDRDGGFGSTGN